MGPEPGARAELVLILAPLGRDADTIATVLGEARIATERCADVAALRRGIARGAGAALIAEEALSPAALSALKAALGEQAPWSDLPLVLVTGAGEHQAARERTVRLLDPAGNVSILERPFRKLTLVTAFESALRARRRQYHMRELTRRLLRAEQERAQAEALRRSEALHRAMARHYPNGAVIVVDPRGRCTLADGQGLTTLALSREAVEGRALADVLPPELAAPVGAALAGQTTSREVARDGRIHVVHGVPLPDAHGGVEAAMLVTHDITEQKRVEEELRRDAELRERFVGVLAHDLRTPLQAVAFTADKLAKGTALHNARRDGERIGRAAERMTRLIRDLLDLARSRNVDGIPIEPAAADLAAICRRAIEEHHAARPERSVQLTVEGDMRGAWDADRIAQVVSNLIGNALTYSPEATPVQVDLRGVDGAVVLDVSNLGTPIPAEALPTIFAPFSRGLHGAEGRGGLGLGLFIVDRIVKAHRGAVSVRSTAEDGTTFTVTLPRRTLAPPSVLPGAPLVETIEVGPRTTPDGAPACPATAGARRLVLVVEDDDDIRDALRDTLEETGYEVLTTANGREALDALVHGARPCVILLDLMMPVMDGWALLDALRADDALAGLPVVIVSAAGGVSAAAPGARRWLSKPIHMQAPLAAVEEHCAPSAA